MGTQAVPASILALSSGHTFPLADLTRSEGIAAALIDLDRPLDLHGTLAIVENLEVFMHIEYVLPDIDAALWSKGRLDERILQWLATQSRCNVLHAGDYDPVGLDE